MTDPTNIYGRAFTLAIQEIQEVGIGRELYITLNQLKELIQNHETRNTS